MTKTLLKLHTTLWLRGLKSNPAQTWMILFVWIYGIIGALSLYTSAKKDFDNGADTTFPALMAAGLVAYLLVCVMMPAGENHIQPERFSALPITSAQLHKAGMWVAFLQSRSILAVVLTVVSAIIGISALGVACLVIPMLLIQLFTTVFAGELLSGFFAGQQGRRSKERNSILASCMIIGLILVYNLMMQNSSDVTKISMAPAGEYMQWTPLAAGPGMVVSAVHGSWGAAVVQFLIAIATLAVLIWGWRRNISRRLIAPLDAQPHEAVAQQTTSLLLPWAPKNQAGMVYSRSVRYLKRDSRLMTSLVMLPMFALIFLFQGLSGQHFAMYLGGFTVAFLIGSIASNDLGYDGPANWVHLATGVPAKTVLLGRHLASVGFGWIMVVLYCIIMLIVDKGAANTWIISGAVVAAAVSAATFGMFFSVVNTFATAPPGTNPWQDRSGYSSAAFISALGTLFLGWIPLAPGIVMLSVGYGTDNMLLKVAGVVVMIVVAVLIYLLAINLLSKRLERTYPEILQKVRAWV